MIDMCASSLVASKGTEKKSSVCLRPVTLISPLINTPKRAICSHHLSGERSIQPTWLNPPAKTARHYFKIVVGKVQVLGGTWKASPGVRESTHSLNIYSGVTEMYFQESIKYSLFVDMISAIYLIKNVSWRCNILKRRPPELKKKQQLFHILLWQFHV